MARPSKEKPNIAVSPINGQPVPRGPKFTSETAKQAREKRTQKEQAQKSITAAFSRYMIEVVAKDKDGTQLTGAQAIAKSIIRGAMKGNAEMVKIALALTGETPNTKIQINSGQLAELIDGLKEPVTDGIHAEAAGVNGAMADG